MVVFDQLLLVRIFGLGFVLLGSSELSDQIKALFFAFEHHVLGRSAADQSLEQDDGHTFPVSFFPFKEWHIVVNFQAHFAKSGSIRPHKLLIEQVVSLGLLFLTLLILVVDESLGFCQRVDVFTLFAIQTSFELELYFGHIDARVEHFRLGGMKHVVQLL